MSAIDYVPEVVFQGDTAILTFDALNPDGTAMDLTGASVDGALVWSGGTVSLTSRIAITLPSAGEVAVTLDPTLIASLPLGTRSRITLWLVDSLGRQSTGKQKPLRIIAR